GYYQNSILKGIEEEEVEVKPVSKPKTFKIDVTGLDVPKSADEFKSWWINEPVSQGNTNTCWSFSTTSYFETEVYRLTKQQVKISQMYTTYWEYIEKARRFIQERGNSAFEEGSEANAVTRMYKMYGAVPYEQYTGMLPGQKFYTHAPLIAELKVYLNSVKANNNWNEVEVLSTVKSILNHYMGVPPSMVKIDGKEITPKDYLKNVLKLNMNDYIDVISLMEKPYWQKVEYDVPDNWWHNADYHNVPLEVFMKIVKDGIRKGYTIGIGGDVSEAGFDANNNIAVIPTFDIPSEYIDENARQFRFSNKTTTDDHGLHLVGYMEKNGKDWYLVKDSGAGSRNCGKESKNFGFYFFHEDYIKLKIMDILIHKDLLKEYINNFKA
ncbi:MAG: C1 family peptidase, partial [Bacteroidota bacterium]